MFLALCLSHESTLLEITLFWQQIQMNGLLSQLNHSTYGIQCDSSTSVQHPIETYVMWWWKSSKLNVLYQPPAMDRGGWTVSLCCHGLRLSLLLGFSLALRRSKSTAAVHAEGLKWNPGDHWNRRVVVYMKSLLVDWWSSWQFQVVHGEFNMDTYIENISKAIVISC